MRQGQQNRRGRGRGRKPQNPLARSFESNGPDVKIRGTAAHVAEKYMSLARDALASGDTVSAESYLQHAEHYNRIIMAAQSQAAPPAQAGEQANGGGHRGHRQTPEAAGEATPATPPAETAEAKTGEAKTGEAKTGEAKTGEAKTGEAKTGEGKTGEGAAPRGERGRDRQGRNGAQPAPESNTAETVEAATADESESAPDTVS